MTIEFKHLNQPATAFIIYNLAEVKEAFLLTPVSYKEDLGDGSLIFKVKNAWQTDSGLSKNFPETFLNIIAAFTKISKTNTRSDTRFLSSKDEIKKAGKGENETEIKQDISEQ